MLLYLTSTGNVGLFDFLTEESGMLLNHRRNRKL